MIKRIVSNIPYRSKLGLYKSMIVPRVLYASCCFGLSMFVSRQLESLQRIVQWILGENFSYKEALYKLKLLPLTMYLQLNDVLMLSKLIQGHYHVDDSRLPGMIFSVRGELKFKSERPSKSQLQQAFFYRTTRIKTP